VKNLEEELSRLFEFLEDRSDRKTLGDDERRRAYMPALVSAMETEFFNLDRLCSMAKSPIEELFACALWSHGACQNVTAHGGDSSSIYKTSAEDQFLLTIRLQAPVGQYSADFLLELGRLGGPIEARIVVEVDGHDFHQRTKQQAAHDKKRDRFFAATGLTVLRFTGSEVTRDAKACASEAMVLLGRMMR